MASPSLTLALDTGEWSAPRNGCFLTQGKSLWYPLNRSWMDPRTGLDNVEKRKSLASAVNLTPTIQPVARFYTDRAKSAPKIITVQ